MESFADNLIEQIREKKSIICIGLDPRIGEKNTIPNNILENAKNKTENESEANNIAIWEFNKQIINETHKITPIYKPQIAFYEKYNALDALKKTIEHIHNMGSLAILDAKRNDIGSTSRAYAQTVFDSFNADAVTVNSYFGIDGVQPFLDYIPRGKGIILLIKTSNPSSGEFQDLFSVNLPKVSSTITEIDIPNNKNKQLRLTRNYIQMARLLKNWSENSDIVKVKRAFGKYGYSSLGGVVGATYPEQLSKIRKEIPKSFILIPGFGAQGGTPKDIVNGINEDGLGAIVNSSRGIDFAYQKAQYAEKFGEADFAKASYEAANEMRKEINQTLREEGKTPF